MPPPLPALGPLLGRRTPALVSPFASLRPTSPTSLLLPPRPFSPNLRSYASSPFNQGPQKPFDPRGSWRQTFQPVLLTVRANGVVFGGIAVVALGLYLAHGSYWAYDDYGTIAHPKDDLPYTERKKSWFSWDQPGLVQSEQELKDMGAVSTEPGPPLRSVLEPEPRKLWVVARVVDDWLIEPILTTLRFLHLAALFVPVILLVPAVWVGPRERLKNGDKGDRAGAIWWYGVLVSQMQRAGPSFIKLAQWAGSRSDLFPARLCEALGQLHSNGKPHSFKHTKRVIERVFKKPFDEVFEEFGHEPIGCGAIAQVYKATLRPGVLPPSHYQPKKSAPPPSPKTTLTTALDPLPDHSPPPASTAPTSAVAIKILHPRVHSTIRRDLKIMAFFAWAINAFPGMEWLSFPEEVDVFGAMMNQQLDLNVEASNLEKFEENFRLRRGAVSFPRPVMDYTSKEVLVEEFENALPLKYFLRNGGGEFDQQLAGMGLDAFLNMLLLDNWTHGDLHPGNIMVKFFKPTTSALLQSMWAYLLGMSQSSSPTTESTKAIEDSDAIVAKLSTLAHDQEAWLGEMHRLFEEGWQPELVFIDAGLVTQLDDTNRRNFLDLFQSLAEFDGYRAGKLMVQRCKTPDLVLEPETFALKIQHLVLSVKSKTFSLARIRISDILGEVLAAVRVNHVKMEGDFVNTILSILLLEGIGRRLDPELDIFQSALPILRQVGRKMGTREAIEGVKGSDLGAMLKLWVWMEARALASGVVVDWEAFVRYDWLTPNL